MYKLKIDETALENILYINMGLKQGESVLLLNDVPGPEDWTLPFDFLTKFLARSVMVREIFDYYSKLKGNNIIDYLTFDSTGQHGAEPPEHVARQMKEHDVVLAITTYSLTHTNAREGATVNGARVASMPGLEPEMLREGGPMTVDYESVSHETLRLAEIIDKATAARVESPAGTAITFSLENRSGRADTGIFSERGQWGNLPAGEAYTAPVEGTAEGTLVVPAGWYERLDTTMKIQFSKGYVTSIKDGGKVGEEFRKLLQTGNEAFLHRRNCAELGIGTNPLAQNAQNTLEAEKILGTVHIAVGDSSHFGGLTESDLHEDFVIPEPTLYLDGKIILKNGILMI
jgi:aminopeptidase